MHTLTLRLLTTKYDCQVMEKRFHAVSHIHNVMVKHAKKLLKRLKHDKEYQTLKTEYVGFLKKQASSKNKTRNACRVESQKANKEILDTEFLFDGIYHN